jgi:hypothetical protein
MRAGTKVAERVSCPYCGRNVPVNEDGRLRHHFPEGGGWDKGGACPGSRGAAAYGSVSVRKLKDGVVVKIAHAPGTMAEGPVTDELVMTDAEWAELMRVTAAEDRERFHGAALYMEGVRAERIRCADLLRERGQREAADIVDGGTL